MAVLSEANQKRVIDLFIARGAAFTAESAAKLKEEASKKGTPFFSLCVEKGFFTSEDLVKATAEVTGSQYVNLTGVQVDQKMLRLLPKEFAERYMAVPIGTVAGGRVALAMLDTDNIQATDLISGKMQRPVAVYMASEDGIRGVLKQYQVDLSGSVAAVVDSGNLAGQTDELLNDATSSQASPAYEHSSPVTRVLNSIFEYSVKAGASDIHIEPAEDFISVRCRVDGVLKEIMRLPKNTEAPLVSRIKILSNLKIDEHRIPQDGQFSISVSGKSIDSRVAVAPVIWGEQVIIRLLDKSGTSLKLEDMGYRGPALQTIRNALGTTSGMILTSGPTGSGKSTSMYALLQEIKSPSINIVTLEDPVEYKVAGINQTPVNNEVGLTFASGLRSILRQDPDVIMIGEIRDKETANLAVQAALTGHLVFSTLHTNSAAGILPRLLDMGIEPFLIASTVHTVIGQRLVRRIKSPEAYQSNAVETAEIQQALGRLLPKTPEEVAQVANRLGYKQLPMANQNAYTLFRGKKTADNAEGFKGRVGLYEVFRVSPVIQDLILKHATSAQIEEAARNEGMITIREDGYLKALAGETTINEINRVASADAA